MNGTFISIKQVVLVFIVTAMGVLPLYGQQNSQAEIFKTAAESNQDRPCWGPREDKRNQPRGLALGKRASARRLSGLRWNLSKVELDFRQNGSRSALSAGETPAVPVRAGSVQATGPATNQSPNQTTNQSANQSNSEPYVFPTPKERFNRYLKSMFGPSALLRSAINAGVNQWQDSPEEWEQGMSGYGKRFASSFGRNAVRHTIVYGLDSALGWDTGFKRSGKDKFGERLKHALLENITSRTKSGKRVFSVPRIAGAYASGVISREAWYPERYGWKDGLRSGNNSMLMGFALNVVREFVVKF